LRPRILSFCCKYCGYAGADLAGVSRIQYPPNLSIVRVPCSGRVTPLHVLNALNVGYDGVLIAGCHPGDCHFLSGNKLCERRLRLLREVLEGAGRDPRRIRLEWISASEAKKFAEVVSGFTSELST
jgi:F420-non-reducing hydrogenase iron-sulfur subunit